MPDLPVNPLVSPSNGIFSSSGPPGPAPSMAPVSRVGSAPLTGAAPSQTGPAPGATANLQTVSPAVPPLETSFPAAPPPQPGTGRYPLQSNSVPDGTGSNAAGKSDFPPPPSETAMEPMVIAAPPPPSGPKAGTYLVMLLLFIVGAGLGYALQQFLPKQADTKPATTAPQKSLSLPADAVQIQACSTGRGTLYVKPQDIPVGPVYMVNKGKIIGIEFMLSRDDFLQGKDYKYLSGLGVVVDHVNVGLLSAGHEGYTAPHYHVDLYTIPREEASQIVCPQTASPTAAVATESAVLTPAAGAAEASEGAAMKQEKASPSPTRRPSPTPR